MSTNLSPAQMQQRIEGISATDIAAIAGVHPYRSAVDVWTSKTSGEQAFDGNDRSRWGTILEPVIRKDFEERRHVRVEVPGTLERGWMRATPDGIVYEEGANEPSGGLEIKCHTIYLSHLYGPPGSDEVPAFELCQCSWNMAVTGLRRWELVAFIDGQPRDYTIEADDELIAMLKDLGERFLVENVRAGIAPEPDGSKSYDRFLAGRFKADNKLAPMRAIDDNAHAIGLVAKLRDLRDQIAGLEKSETEVVQALKVLIGDYAGLEWAAGKKRERVTWKTPKPSIETDWKAVAEEQRRGAGLVASAKADDAKRAITALDRLSEQYFANTRATITGKQIRELIESLHQSLVLLAGDSSIRAHTQTVPNSRRFCVPKSWSKNKEQA